MFVLLADDTVVRDFFDLYVAAFGVVSGGDAEERLLAFGDRVGDFAAHPRVL